ncbi:hypothetical protein OIU79_008097 [Salix purpurea]|uniref:Uncharacterized protein n=1 Tax=Salix purpurea TaxID=77065 RepID=A0A9Q0THM3_SALPP|nr:hypothetical protein OIU79_008097 [Salix purpurea]
MRGKSKGLLVRAFILGSHRSSMNSFSRRLHENLISNPTKTSHPTEISLQLHHKISLLNSFSATLPKNPLLLLR